VSERYTYEAIFHLDGSIHYRITDTVGDDRVATCFLEENAKAVTEALNTLEASRLVDMNRPCTNCAGGYGVCEEHKTNI
jgi:hypothetical protein